MILAIDPGPEQSAYVALDKNLKPIKFGKVDNSLLLEDLGMDRFQRLTYEQDYFVIEMVASYGMAVGAEVFETVFWIGRFWERWAYEEDRHRIYRKDVKMNLCQSMKAKDGNVRQALIDRFGPVGTKKNPGWFYGVSGDVWSAIAVGVTFADTVLAKMAEYGA